MGRKNKNTNLRAASNGDQQLVEASYHEGPIPSPDVLAKYESIHQGLANRIMTMAENQSSHRIEIEKKVVRCDTHNSKVGMYFAFIIVVLGILVGGALIFFNKALEGGLTAATPFIIIVGNFLIQEGKKNSKK